MTGDIRKQLIEALDEAPGKRQGHFGGCSSFMFAVGATCNCGFAEWLGRLIERDRALLADHAAAELGVRGAMYLTHVDGLQPYPLAVQKREALKAELDRAAAFWLGTPEAGQPQHCTTGGCHNAPTQTLDGEPRCDFCVSVMTAPVGSSEVTDGR